MQIIIMGATGLVGSRVLRLALQDSRISFVRVFGRRSTGVTHQRLLERIISFDRIDDWANEIRGDALLLCLGTTLQDAGSQQKMRKVDFDYQLQIAKAARRNCVSTLALISSAKANAKSSFFYLKMKGELEEAVHQLDFDRLRILRPGPLAGKREKPRWQEQLTHSLLPRLLPSRGFDDLRPVTSEIVAQAMLESAMGGEERFRVLTANEIHAGYNSRH